MAMDQADRQRQFEDQFLKQLRARARELLQRGLPADQFTVDSLPDGVDAVRATLTRLGHFDRDLLEKLPGTRALRLHFRRRVLGPFSRQVARVRAQVLTSTEDLVEGREPGPVGREAVLDALARYELLPKAERPTAAVLASPTGFTAEAKALVHAGGTPTLILMGGRADGGWDVELPEVVRNTPWARLFELESQDERLQRLLYHLERNASLLDSSGVSVPELAAQLGLPTEQVAGLVRQACRHDSRLLTVQHDGTTHVCRSPLPAEEGHTMSLMSWIRKLLRMKPTVAEQVRLLTAQRVQLEQQRRELDQRLDALEQEERETVERGSAAKTDVERRQLAGKLMRTRRQLRRVQAQANVFTQQIDVLGTHIHHLTLAQQGKQVALPSSEELTREAAEAEQIMSELSVSADLAAGIEVGATSPAMADEEQAILDEFKQAAGPEPSAPEPERESTPERPQAAPPEQRREPPQRESGESGESARPEMG